MSDLSLVVSLFVCLFSAAVLTVLHFQMKLRLEAARLPVKWFMTFSDDLRMWRMYRREAAARQWPTWPFFAYRILLVLFALSSVLVFFNSDKLFRVVSFRFVFDRMDWIIAWMYVTSLALAIVFTVRLVSKLPIGECKVMCQTLLKDEYLRSDLYAAILCWSGIPLVYFSTHFLRHIVGH